MEKNTKIKIFKIIGISIIASIIFELLLKFAFKVETQYLIDKIIVDSFILSFLGFHIFFELSKIYDFIIKHRYKIATICVISFSLLQYSGSSNGILTNWVLEPEKSNTVFGVNKGIRSDEYALETPLAVSQEKNDYSYNNGFLRGTSTDIFSVVHAPVNDILSVGKLYNIGHLVFQNTSFGLAFYWNLRLFALILVSYELCSIITKNKKAISIAGTLMIVFSSAVQWNFSNAFVDILIFGQLVLVLLDKFLKSEKFKIRLLCLVGITISAISCIFTFYPPYIVSFVYVFTALAIWIIIKNRKNCKIAIKDIFSMIICVVVGIVLCFRYFNLSENTLNIIFNTSYPGERAENGGGGTPYLFTYLYNFLMPFMSLGDNCALASIISLFPIPMIMAIYYMYKNEKHISFLLPLSIVAVFETVFCISGFPDIISKLTLFEYTLIERTAVAVAFANFYLLIYMISNIEENFVNIKSAIRISLVIMCVMVFIPLPTSISSKGYMLLFAGFLCLYTFLFLNNGDIRYRKVLLVFLVIFSLVGGILVNPITKGTYAITNTDIAKVIQEIASEDENALWISSENMMVLANYAMANGAKTLNSTNIYPNAEFFEAALGKEKAEEQKEIWNRYAHIEVVLGEENFVELIDKDKVRLNIELEKLKELKIKYIITYENYDFEDIELEKVYEKYISEPLKIADKNVNSIYIYKILN